MTMDLRYKLIISGVTGAFILDSVAIPTLIAESTAQNLIGFITLGTLGWLNYLFYTQTENKWDK